MTKKLAEKKRKHDPVYRRIFNRAQIMQEILGMAKSLKNLVQRRFGDLPDWAISRIDRADVDTLERWTYLVLDATSVEDVFRDDEVTQD